MVALRFADGALWALDQTLLPWREAELELRSADDVAAAIKRLAIRGAPLIGVAAAYGVALELARDPDGLERACKTLVSARPTAVNLGYAVKRVHAAVAASGDAPAAAALAEARLIEAQEESASDALAAHGADELADCRRILTHCNTGALAAPGRGTALAVLVGACGARLARARAGIGVPSAASGRTADRVRAAPARDRARAARRRRGGGSDRGRRGGRRDRRLRPSGGQRGRRQQGRDLLARAGGGRRRDPVRRRGPDFDDRSGVPDRGADRDRGARRRGGARDPDRPRRRTSAS